MSSLNTAIAMAHTVCAELDNNQETSVVAMSLMKGHRSLAETIQLLHRRFYLCLLPAIHRTDRQFDVLALPRARLYEVKTVQREGAGWLP